MAVNKNDWESLHVDGFMFMVDHFQWVMRCLPPLCKILWSVVTAKQPQQGRLQIDSPR